MKKYKFIPQPGADAGVPGLPHEITDEEAKQLGVENILKEAIANGSYKEEKPAAKPASKELNKEISNGKH